MSSKRNTPEKERSPIPINPQQEDKLPNMNNIPTQSSRRQLQIHGWWGKKIEGDSWPVVFICAIQVVGKVITAKSLASSPLLILLLEKLLG